MSFDFLRTQHYDGTLGRTARRHAAARAAALAQCRSQSGPRRLPPVVPGRAQHGAGLRQTKSILAQRLQLGKVRPKCPVFIFKTGHLGHTFPGQGSRARDRQPHSLSRFAVQALNRCQRCHAAESQQTSAYVAPRVCCCQPKSVLCSHSSTCKCPFSAARRKA